MQLNEIFGFLSNRRTEKKRQAAITKIRSKEKARRDAASKAKRDAAKRQQLAKDVEAGDRIRANAAPKNTKKRNLKDLDKKKAPTSDEKTINMQDRILRDV